MPRRTSNTTTVLLGRAKTGDQSAFEELVERHQHRVYRSASLRIAACMPRLRFDISDIVQEAWIYVDKTVKAQKFDENRTDGGFRNWMAKVVLNKARDLARSNQRQPPQAESVVVADLAVGGDRPPEILEAQELDARHQAALLGLPQKQRQVVDLRDNCEMRFEEIAKEMGYSNPGSARAAYHRAKEALGEKLQ